MTVPTQVFTLFYAVLYGALFTITDKWRPLMGTFAEKGRKRVLPSVVCYGLAPVLYFELAFNRFQHVYSPTFINLLASIYCVVPLVFFHFCWIWWVVPHLRSSYERRNFKDEALTAAIHWTLAGNYRDCRAKAMSLVVLLALPLAVLLFLPLCQTSSP